MLNFLVFVTLYRIPSIVSDLGRIPGMTRCQATIHLLDPAGHYRVRRLIHLHVRGIVADVLLLIENICIFIGILVLLVRLPSYLVYIPTCDGLLDLRQYGLQCMKESYTDWCALFGMLLVSETWQVFGRAVAFAFLMPATALASVFNLFFGCCCGHICQFFSAMGLFLVLAITPLAIVFNAEPGDGASILNGVQSFGMGLLILLVLSTGGTCMKVSKTRKVSTARWSSPQLRLDKCPNIFALLTLPAECFVLLIACLAGFNGAGSSVGGITYTSPLSKGAIRWPSFVEDSDYGNIARTWTYGSMVCLFLFLFFYCLMFFAAFVIRIPFSISWAIIICNKIVSILILIF